jgi:hypothetical protein
MDKQHAVHPLFQKVRFEYELDDVLSKLTTKKSRFFIGDLAKIQFSP